MVSGSGTLTQLGPGTLTLTGANTYTGATTVTAGTLLINGTQTAATGAVSVAAGATLGGTGTTGGVVTVADGGHLSPGAGPGTLTTGGLVLSPGALLDYELTTPGVVGGATNDLTVVNGALTLDGVLNISGAFAPGTYRLLNYTGALTDNTLDVRDGAGRRAARDRSVRADVGRQPGEPDQLVRAATLTVWDGGNTAFHDNGVIDGGAGVWSATANRNWTQADGAINGHWTDNAVATFQGTGGTVTVDNTSGAVRFSGATFAVDGYTITGQPLTTTTAATPISVGTGLTATIAAVLQGSGGINKTDLGTLVLHGRQHLHRRHDRQRRHAVDCERRESGRGDRRPDPEWRHAADDGRSDLGARRDAGRGGRHDRQRRVPGYVRGGDQWQRRGDVQRRGHHHAGGHQRLQRRDDDRGGHAAARHGRHDGQRRERSDQQHRRPDREPQ